jgi:cytoskeletal protein CcmA (bactofilin family)
VVVTGNVSASVDIHVEGRIEGDITCANLVQGSESLIKGAIVAESARLSGTVEGSIIARDLTILATARITGDVTYDSLTIEQGSQVDGRFTHRRAGSAGAQRSIANAIPAQVEVIPAT